MNDYDLTPDHIVRDGKKIDAPLHAEMLESEEGNAAADELAARIAIELGFPDIAEDIRRK